MKKIFKSIILGMSITLMMLLNTIDVKATQDFPLLEDFTSLRYIGYQPTQNVEDTLNFNSSKSVEYPESYDMRELGLVGSTKSQGTYGTCWAFATVESALSGILSSNPLENLSEWHLAYFTYTGNDAIEFYSKGEDSSPFYKGGNSSFAVTTLSKWFGFVSEDVAPYGSSTTLDDSLKTMSQYHLTDAYSFNGAFSTSLDTSYRMNDIKQSILDGHSVMLDIYFSSSSEYYSQTDSSFYYPNMDSKVNHEVTIVGWDDNFYSYDGITNKPQSKGAWLVKNSWGYDFGQYGYCWISYENPIMIDATSFIVEDSNNYTHNYYLDDYGWVTSINSLDESSNANSPSAYYDYASNIFTSQTDEDICAVSLYTTDYDVDYTISIYTNLDDDTNPTSGTLQSTTSGSIHQMGYHTIELETPVSVDIGEKYSVVVRLSNPYYKNTIAIESSISFFNVVDGVADIYSYNVSRENILDNTSPYESFISNDGYSWTSTYGICGIMHNYDSDFTYEYTPSFDISTLDDGNYGISILGNVCIKSFTKAKDKVDFSQYGGYLNVGDTIELSNHNENTIYYTLDGSTPTMDSYIYTQPIQFTGENLTISARTLIDGTLGDIYTESFTQSRAVLSTLCIKEYNGEEYTFTEVEIASNGEPITDIHFNCKDDTIAINLYSIGNGDIYISNESITSGHETQSIEVYNNLTIPISVSKDGMKSTQYTLLIDEILQGDLDFNLILDYTDILTLKKYLLGLSELSTEQISSADINLDGVVNLLDLLTLKNLVLHI